jgi:hypothetical protein
LWKVIHNSTAKAFSRSYAQVNKKTPRQPKRALSKAELMGIARRRHKILREKRLAGENSINEFKRIVSGF